MRSFLKKIYTNEFARGGMILTTTSFLTNILNYLFNLISARSLGPAGYGELASFFSYSFILSVPLAVISTILIQKIGSSGSNRFIQAHRYETFFLSKIRNWWPFFLLLLFFSLALPRLTNLSAPTAYSLIPMLILSFFTIFYTSALQGLRLFTLFAFLSFLTVVIKLCGAVLVGVGIGGLSTIMISLFIGTFLVLFAGHFALSKKIENKNNNINLLQKKIRSIIRDKQFLITLFSVLAITLFNNMDIVFVKKYFSPPEAGIYALWALFAKIILYVITPLISVSFVFFSGVKNENDEQRTLVLSLIGLCFVGVGSFFIYSNFSKILITTFFGRRYDSLIPYLSKASLFGTFYTAIFFINNYFLAKKRGESILLAFAIVIYIALLFGFGKSLTSIMNINIIFSGGLLVVLLFSLLLKRK